MSTASFLILSALTKIGKNSPLKKAKASDVSIGLSSLESLLAQFDTMNIVLPVNPVRGISEEIGETLDTRNAIINNLSIEISTNYDNGQAIVSASLQTNADSGMAFLRKWYTKDSRPVRRISSTAPLGAGNERFRFSVSSRKFFGPVRALREPDSEVEPER
jgi:hypothetical protein